MTTLVISPCKTNIIRLYKEHVQTNSTVYMKDYYKLKTTCTSHFYKLNFEGHVILHVVLKTKEGNEANVF